MCSCLGLNWFLGYVLESNDTCIKVEHLERVATSIDSAWRYSKYDIQDGEHDQGLPINVLSEWDYSDPEHFILVVKNFDDISSCFQKFIEE